MPTGLYTLSEAGTTANTGNYDFTSLTCGADDVTATLQYDLQGDTTCTFLNSINVAEVTLVKAVSDAGVLNSLVLAADNKIQ